MAGSEREEEAGITAPFAHGSNKNNAFHELNLSDGIREDNIDAVGKFPVRRTHID